MPLTVVQTLPALDTGGVERGTVEVARELVRRGHRAVVISAGGRLVGQLEACGATHIEMEIGRKSPFTLRHVGRLRALLTRLDADILHTRSRLPAWISYLAWRGMPRESRPRFLTTVHGPYTVNAYSRIMTRGERVVAISDFIRRYVLEHYPDTDPARITTIHRGVSAEEFPHGFRPDPDWMQCWQDDHPRLQDQALITLPARITRWKGQLGFIALLARLRQRGHPVHGLIVGAAAPRHRGYLQALRSKATALGIDPHVTFTGHRDDVREIMSVSRLVVSLADTPEAFGRVALEALSLGVPVAAYAHGGVEEILTAIYPAGLIPPADGDRAVEVIEGLLRTAPAVPASHPFPLQRMLDETLALYGSLSQAS